MATNTLSSQEIVLFRRTLGTLPVNLASNTMRNIATGDAMLQFRIIVLIIRTLIAGISISAAETAQRTRTAGMRLQSLVGAEVPVLADDAIGGIFAGEAVGRAEVAASFVIEVTWQALIASCIVAAPFAVG
jgi:hypothetical protein